MAGTVRVRRPAGISHPKRIDPADRLRLSVTDACNYSCSFCHNEGSLQTGLSTRNQLSESDARFYVNAGVEAGVVSIKITGGEPLIYSRDSMDIACLVEAVCEATQGRAAVSITTNGQLLKRHARRLSETPLSHLTVSVHTLDQRVFRNRISMSGSPRGQLEGIHAARAAGIGVKANVVVLPETLREVPLLCRELFAAGAEKVRLYRALWSPLSSGRAGRERVSDEELIDLASQVAGLSRDMSIDSYARTFLRSRIAGLPRGICFDGDAGSVELDRMPMPRSESGPWDEGNYALRISTLGGLHSRLFSPVRDLSGFALVEDMAGALGAIAEAREEMVVLE